MKKNCLLFLLLALALLVPACSKPDSKSPGGLSAERNAAAPDFALKDLSGRNISLSDHKGKVVLLEFWATWCPPCKASVPALIELNRKYGQKGLVVIGVSIDTDSDALEKVKQFAAAHNINYPVLLADEVVQKAYDITSIPTTILIGKDGKVVDVYKGYSEELDKTLSVQIGKLL